MQIRLQRYVINNEAQLFGTLDLIYKSSKDNAEIYDIIEVMKNEQTIMTAIHNIKSNKGSYTKGIDKKDIDHYLQMDTTKLIQVIRKYIDDYNPKPVRRVYIPKKNGKLRPLGIPTMVDRIIQEITRIVLEPIAEAKFFSHSYGFRPYRNTEHAIARIVHLVNTTPCHFLIEGDIKSYFDNVNHNVLIRTMWNMGIRDKRVLIMVKKMLKAGVMEEGAFKDSDLGTPQGGIISPLLANIYLNCFDWFIAEKYEEHPYMAKYMETCKSTVNKIAKDNARKKVKLHHPQVYLVRYADDWVILTESQEQANNILNQSRKFFKYRLFLELSDEKTLITDLTKSRVEFLGFELYMERKRFTDKLVCKTAPNRESLKAKTRQILDSVKAIRYQETPLKIVTQVEKVNSMIMGVANYYKISIAKEVMQNLDNQVFHTALKTVRRLYGSGKDRLIDIDKVNNLTNRHQGYKVKTFYFDYNELKIGITKASITPIYYARKFDQRMTPYTIDGREIRRAKDKKWQNRFRPTLYNPYEIFSIIGNNTKRGNIYNFEYIMNREYAFNRDKGKCVACKDFVYTGTVKCHHKNRKLSMNKINKLNNLTTLCDRCHSLVHSSIPTDNKKILELRKFLEEENKC